MATKEQIKKIYALGAVCQLLDRSRGNDDELHLFVRQYTPKTEHISDLTDKMADFIIQRLKDYSKHLKSMKAADVMSSAQKSKVFGLMYRLAELSPSETSVRDRLAGVIGRLIGKTPPKETDVFSGLSAADGHDLIETLKRYITNEERKRKRGERDGNVGSGGAAPP